MQVGLSIETSRLTTSDVAAIRAKASILYMAATKFAVVEVAGSLALVRVTCLAPYKGYIKGTPDTIISFEEGSILHTDGITALSDLTAADTVVATATAAAIFSRRTRLLPEDMLDLIFRSLVPPELLVSCLGVCKTWRRVALRLLHFQSHHDSHDGKAEELWSQCLARDAEELSASISVDMSSVLNLGFRHPVALPIVFRAVLIHRLKVHVARPASVKTIETHDPHFLGSAKGVLKMNQIDCTQCLASVLTYLVTLLGVQMRNLVRHIVKTPSVDTSSIVDPAVAIVDTVTTLLYQLLLTFRSHDATVSAQCGRVYARGLKFTSLLSEIVWLQDSVFLPADDDRRMYHTLAVCESDDVSVDHSTGLVLRGLRRLRQSFN